MTGDPALSTANRFHYELDELLCAAWDSLLSPSSTEPPNRVDRVRGKNCHHEASRLTRIISEKEVSRCSERARIEPPPLLSRSSRGSAQLAF